ncbi:hypothetical protein PQX77_010465 [Marasmius sp. AFHP31]|nr:hypothetical protein PQX77_010465 [Marasmius sp. AFHP31]
MGGGSRHVYRVVSMVVAFDLGSPSLHYHHHLPTSTLLTSSPPPSPLPSPPSKTSVPHTQPAREPDILVLKVLNCPPSLKWKRGKNNVVESVVEEAVDEAVEDVTSEPKKRKGKKVEVEEAVDEVAGSVVAEPKKRKGKKKAAESGVEEVLDKEAAGNVTQQKKRKTTKQHRDIRLVPAKGTLERSPEKVRGRTRQQARKNAQLA